MHRATDHIYVVLGFSVRLSGSQCFLFFSFFLSLCCRPWSESIRTVTHFSLSWLHTPVVWLHNEGRMLSLRSDLGHLPSHRINSIFNKLKPNFSQHAYVDDFPALHKTTQNLLRIHMQLKICTELLYRPLTTTILVADPTAGKGVGMSTSKPEWSRIIAFYANFRCILSIRKYICSTLVDYCQD